MMIRLWGTNKIGNSEGFTLVEVLAAVFVLAIAMVGVMGVFVNATILMDHVKNVSIASNLVSERIEIIRNVNYDNLLDMDGAFESPGMEELPNASGLLELEDPFNDDNIRKVNVTISWTTDQGRSADVTMSTYVTRDGINNDI
jgi:prepilin-type N-terminal cleavage/methylation domain-containing protein